MKESSAPSLRASGLVRRLRAFPLRGSFPKPPASDQGGLRLPIRGQNLPLDLDPIFLHAVRYSGPDWSYQAPLPSWATEALASAHKRKEEGGAGTSRDASGAVGGEAAASSGSTALAGGREEAGDVEGDDPASTILRVTETGALVAWPETLWTAIPAGLLEKYGKLLPDEERGGGGGGGAEEVGIDLRT